jgi:hypothetical protein
MPDRASAGCLRSDDLSVRHNFLRMRSVGPTAFIGVNNRIRTRWPCGCVDEICGFFQLR